MEQLPQFIVGSLREVSEAVSSTECSEYQILSLVFCRVSTPEFEPAPRQGFLAGIDHLALPIRSTIPIWLSYSARSEIDSRWAGLLLSSTAREGWASLFADLN